MFVKWSLTNLHLWGETFNPNFYQSFVKIHQIFKVLMCVENIVVSSIIIVYLSLFEMFSNMYDWLPIVGDTLRPIFNQKGKRVIHENQKR